MLAEFLKFAGISSPVPAPKLGVSVQKYPFAAEPAETDAEKQGIPDAWIFDDDWAVVVEAKITAGLDLSQIERHKRAASRCGFEKSEILAIVAKPTSLDNTGFRILSWKDIYRWLKSRSKSQWAGIASDYFEKLETRMMNDETLGNAALTTFSGYFSTSSDYNYGEAKRQLKLSMEVLRRSKVLIDKLGMKPAAKGRPQITGINEGVVWDVLRLESDPVKNDFNSHPHLTLGVACEQVEAVMTLPNGFITGSKSAFKRLGDDDFEAACLNVLSQLEPTLKSEPFARPFMRGIQRRFPARRAKPFIDALIEFDLRTIKGAKSGPKQQSQWLHALYGSSVAGNLNYQIQIGVAFPYGKCDTISTADALGLVVDAWCACLPLLQVVRAQSG